MRVSLIISGINGRCTVGHCMRKVVTGRRTGHQFHVWTLAVNTRCPVRLCVRLIAVNQTIDSQPPGIQILLIYTRTDVTCKRNYGVDGRRQGTFAYKMLKLRRRCDSRRTVNAVLATLRLRNSEALSSTWYEVLLIWATRVRVMYWVSITPHEMWSYDSDQYVLVPIHLPTSEFHCAL
jgi:hypothetical protein